MCSYNTNYLYNSSPCWKNVLMCSSEGQNCILRYILQESKIEVIQLEPVPQTPLKEFYDVTHRKLLKSVRFHSICNTHSQKQIPKTAQYSCQLRFLSFSLSFNLLSEVSLNCVWYTPTGQVSVILPSPK